MPLTTRSRDQETASAWPWPYYTNAFQYGQAADVGLRLLLTATHIGIEVDDGTPAPPRLRAAGLLDEHGRGLALVAFLADDWGISPDGTRTWCTLTTPFHGEESHLPRPTATSFRQISPARSRRSEEPPFMNCMTPDTDQARTLRNKVVDELVADRTILSPKVEAVMRKVPRHCFTPDVSLEDAYDTYVAVVTKKNENGVAVSSVSAPQIQALMLEQAKIRPGMRVLEVGSGGLNAAYLAELVGEEGAVTTVDIDSEVTDRARRLLDENGYQRVDVVCADAAEPIPGLGTVDVILVTAGAWDIPPMWFEALKPGGRLVVPLRMRGLTRSIAFVHNGDHLESESAKICGFVPMQGSAAQEEKLLLVAGTPEIGLRFDDRLPKDLDLLDNAAGTERVQRWTGITMGRSELQDTLQLHLAIRLPGFCIMTVDPELDTGIVAPANKNFALAAVEGGTFGYLVIRRTTDEQSIEFGIHALGADAESFITKFGAVLDEWARDHREGPGPVVRVYPAGTPPDQIPGDRVIDKVHSRISLSWPPVSRREGQVSRTTDQGE